MVQGMKQDYREGYYGNVVGGAVALFGASLADLVMLPFIATWDLAVVTQIGGHEDSFGEKRTAKRIWVNLESGTAELNVKHKPYTDMIDYISKIALKPQLN